MILLNMVAGSFNPNVMLLQLNNVDLVTLLQKGRQKVVRANALINSWILVVVRETRQSVVVTTHHEEVVIGGAWAATPSSLLAELATVVN